MCVCVCVCVCVLGGELSYYVLITLTHYPRRGPGWAASGTAVDNAAVR